MSSIEPNHTASAPASYPGPFPDDLSFLRWAHARLTEMGYEPTDDDEQHHPLTWWEDHRKSWAYALEAQAEELVEIWAEHASDLGFTGWKQQGS